MNKDWIKGISVDENTGIVSFSPEAGAHLLKLTGSKATTLGGQKKAVQKLFTQILKNFIEEKSLNL